MEESIFSKIIKGEIGCYKIAEDKNNFAFLDINPNAKGHTLCISKKQVDKLSDLDDSSYLSLMAFSKKVAIAIEKTISCNRVGMAVIGIEVPHVHIHLIPINSMKDMTFQKKINLTKEQFQKTAVAIANNFDTI